MSDLPLEVVTRTEQPAPPAPPLWRRLLRGVKFLPAIPVLLMTGALVGIYFQPPGLRKMMALLGIEPGGGTSSPIAVPAPKPPAAGGSTPVAPAPPPVRSVTGLGKLIPDGDVITVSPPFGASDARIAEMRVVEGGVVARGDLLALLDNESQLKAALEAAKAALGVREAGLAQTRATVLATREEGRAALARAEAALHAAQRDFERTEEIHRRGFATEAALDQRRAARDQLAREVDAAKAKLSRFNMADAETQTDVVVARSSMEAAEADVARATSDLERAHVRAPIAGTVLTIHIRPGEKPGAKGILNLGNIERMMAEVEIYQTQIGQVRVGQPVELSAAALGSPLHGEVTRIGLEVGRQTLVDATPAANTDARVVKVTVALDPASSAVARRFTNLQVVARITATSQP